jgi:streptogramin lyase
MTAAAAALSVAVVVAPAAAAAPTATEFSAGLAAGSGPASITAGPDGNLWFTEYNDPGRIGRITPAGTITEFSAGLTANSSPHTITAGPDGNIWFTEYASPGRIGRITPAGTITEFTTGLTPGGGPLGIAAGPDGNLWFTEANGSRIGRITPAGTITELTTGLTANSTPWEIAAGPDGNLWFTEFGPPARIGRITPAGTITEFTTGLTPDSFPWGIVAGPDGNLWFTEYAAPGAIGRITTAGTVTEFTTGLAAKGFPIGIATGPDGNLWFTDNGIPGRIGRITPAGTVSEFTAGLTADGRPFGIAAGPDGNLWFTEEANPGRIGRINTDVPAPTSGNLLRNPGAEEGMAASSTTTRPVLGWAATPNFTPVAYGSPAFPGASESARIGGGDAFFAGGPATSTSSAIQNVDVSMHAAAIDAGRVRANLAGELGGWSTDNDAAALTARFLDVHVDALGSLAIPPVLAADRGNKTGFVARATSGAVPAGTRTIQVVVSTVRTNGSFDDALADNLSLRLDIADPPPAGGGGGGGAGGALPVLSPVTATTLPLLAAPALGNLALSPSRFRAATVGASTATAAERAKPSVGTRVGYTLDRAAAVTFTVTRSVAGVRKGTRCVAAPARRAKGARPKRCTLTRTIGTFAHDSSAGANSLRFTGRVANRALPAGRYGLIVAAKANGATGRPLSAPFTIAR